MSRDAANPQRTALSTAFHDFAASASFIPCCAFSAKNNPNAERGRAGREEGDIANARAGAAYDTHSAIP